MKGVKGNGKTLGWTDGTHKAGTAFASSNGIIRIDDYNKNVGASTASSANMNNVVIGITTDASKSGIESNTDSNIKYAIKYYI